MAITRLTGFKGEAEVLGRLVQFTYGEDGLLFHGLSQAEALEVLAAAALGKMAAVNPLSMVQPGASAPAPKKAKRGGEVPPPPAPTAMEEAIAVKQVEVAAKQLEQAKVGHDITTAPPSQVVEPTTGAAEAAAMPGPAVNSAPAGAGHPPDNVVQLKAPEGTVPDITKAKQLKDVLSILMEHHGIKSVDGLIAKCEELKTTVPVLTRIQDLPGRVKRAMELLSA